jgi:hypothetical protein
LSSGTTIYLLVLLHDGTSTKPGNPRVFPIFSDFPISKTGVMEASGDRITSLSMDTMSKKRASLSTVKEEESDAIFRGIFRFLAHIKGIFPAVDILTG